jgi:thiol-disulfide isomerase/thioredoxin
MSTKEKNKEVISMWVLSFLLAIWLGVISCLASWVCHASVSTNPGQYKVVNYWAEWCSFCIEEMPEIAKFRKNHPEVEFQAIYGESISQSELDKFVKQYDYPSSLNDGSVLAALPTTKIYKDGKLIKTIAGATTESELSEWVKP